TMPRSFTNFGSGALGGRMQEKVVEFQPRGLRRRLEQPVRRARTEPFLNLALERIGEFAARAINVARNVSLRSTDLRLSKGIKQVLRQVAQGIQQRPPSGRYRVGAVMGEIC